MRPERVLLLILLAGVLARVVYLGEVVRLPFFQDPVGDSALHLRRAQEILQGRWIGDAPFFYGGILYPYLIALSLGVFGANLYPLCLAQTLAGCALAWVLYRILLEGSGEPRERRAAAGVTAAAIVALYGPLAFLEADLLMISWTLLMMMAAAWLLLRCLRQPGSRAGGASCLLAGVLLGLAASERPNLVALVPAAALWAGWFTARPGRARRAAMLIAGGGIVIAGIAWMNHAASSRWVLLTTSSGINFFIGNRPEARGTFDEPWSGSDPAFAARYTDLEESSLRMARRLSGRPLDAVAASHYWFGRGLEYLRADPSGAARLYLRKLALFWNGAEVPNHLDFTFMRSLAAALWLMPLGFWFVGPLGLYGFLSPSARGILGRPATLLMALFVLVPMATVLPFFVADRYRIVVVPALILLAAAGLVDLAGRLSNPALRRGGLARAGAIALAMLVAGVPLADFDRSRDHWMLAQAYKKQGDLPMAEASYLRALDESPDNALVHNNLGVVLGMKGDERGAEAAYRRALEIEPSLARPRRNLGLLLTTQGKLDEAFGYLQTAEEADPSDLDVAAALAFIYMSRDEEKPAVERARKVLDGRPGDLTALSVLEAAGTGPTPPARP